MHRLIRLYPESIFPKPEINPPFTGPTLQQPKTKRQIPGPKISVPKQYAPYSPYAIRRAMPFSELCVNKGFNCNNFPGKYRNDRKLFNRENWNYMAQRHGGHDQINYRRGYLQPFPYNLYPNYVGDMGYRRNFMPQGDFTPGFLRYGHRTRRRYGAIRRQFRDRRWYPGRRPYERTENIDHDVENDVKVRYDNLRYGGDFRRRRRVFYLTFGRGKSRSSGYYYDDDDDDDDDDD